MQIFISILVFIVIFSLVIFVHELGHFLAAKRARIYVEEFGFGMPPRIWGKKVGETVYSVNWIPFGGFLRILGENGGGKSNKRSFGNAHLRSRFFVAVGGVVMNLIMAFLFLTLGFWIGIEPLIATTDDFIEGIESGQIVIETGMYVKSVEVGSVADELGIEVGDKISSVDSSPLTMVADFYLAFEDGMAVLEVDGKGSIKFEGDGSKLGMDFYSFDMPRVKIVEVAEGSLLQEGDVILRIDGVEIFGIERFYEIKDSAVDYDVLRSGEVVAVELVPSVKNSALITKIFQGSGAEEAGLIASDVILSINGQEILKAEDVPTVTLAQEDDVLTYVIKRDGTEISFDVLRNEEGYVGIYVADIESVKSDVSAIYEETYVTSVMEIKKVRYGFLRAPVEAVSEIKRLSILTFGVIKEFFGGLITKGEVSDSVAGPVGIAQMTYVFFKEGFAALVRFIALLSLSLAVFNIIPFPGLDGGRFAFLLFEAFTGRKPNAKVEAVFHSVGFMLLMLLLVVVTYKDVIRIVQ
ncbi:MAG: peptidase M50, regulator of sigma E protease [Candidatus Peregrinibacteria bacterium GW2011_GWF2_43_17]|nr:MAG: peptidase M50, regulator of sigma E protease [Candidatus Peregrinibacteria bacterium GW2011_GWF2_43_17]HAU39487.1 hypothetical protein [Candidatus Peregrinibacteria bacterium]